MESLKCREPSRYQILTKRFGKFPEGNFGRTGSIGVTIVSVTTYLQVSGTSQHHPLPNVYQGNSRHRHGIRRTRERQRLLEIVERTDGMEPQNQVGCSIDQCHR